MPKCENLHVVATQVESVAEPFWRDLVDRKDYLEPRGGWLLRQAPAKHVATGELVVSLNPELHATGDFVTRCLVRRVEVLAEILANARQAIHFHIRSLGCPVPECISTLAADAERLDVIIRDLYTICWPNESAGIRDSCVILTQAYLAFHPAPDVEWLGLEAHVVKHGRQTLRDRMTRNPETRERLAAALGDLQRLYVNEPPGRAAREEAIARGGLVLTQSPRVAYWNRIPIPFHQKENRRRWDMLLALAQKARRGTAVTELDVFEDKVSDSAMATLWSRLKNRLPPDLRKHVEPGDAARSYRLELESSQIDIFE